MLANTKLLNALQNYDKNKITPGMHRKILEYYKDKSFNEERIHAVSTACANLYKWVDAMKEYYIVNKRIEPLRKELKMAR